MKRILTVILALAFGCALSNAQDIQDTETTVHVQSVFTTMPENVTVVQPESVRKAMDAHVEKNARREAAGYLKEQTYRIRIYFSNKQNARSESAMIEEKFKENFPGVPVYRTYPNPHFKVAVGNYRTKSDALKALEEIKTVFKDAYILKEREMDFPAIN